MFSFQDVKDIQKTDSNAEYYHQTQSCRIKTYGFEQVLLQHRFLFQDVNCIEKSATNANSGAKDEAIVFTMRRGGKTFIFGQVVALSYSSPIIITEDIKNLSLGYVNKHFHICTYTSSMTSEYLPDTA